MSPSASQTISSPFFPSRPAALNHHQHHQRQHQHHQPPPPPPLPCGRLPSSTPPSPSTSATSYSVAAAKPDPHITAVNRPITSKTTPTKPPHFPLILTTLCLAQLLCAFETTVTATALPAIVRELSSGGGDYVWVLNGYLLSCTVSQPLYGQFAGLCGRRYPLIFAVGVFTVGSAVSGAARNMTGLIGGRVVQGVGGGGIIVMTQIIISDAFSVRERGKYLGILYGVFGVGLAVGPIIGGEIIQHGDWRWVFWLNVPVGGVVLIALGLFLQVTYKKTGTLLSRLRDVDWVGNGLLIASVTSVLVGLSWADVRYSWSSFHFLAPLIAGFAGTVLFHIFEASRYCKVPTLPPQLFTNRTCAAALVLTFLQMLLAFWRAYYLPIYLQAVLLYTPGRSGVLLLPSFVSSMPFYVMAGHLLTKTGRYKPIHFFGFGLLFIAAGLYTTFGTHSSLLEIIVFQSLGGIGVGCTMMTLLPAAQADMPQSMVAAVTAGLGFVRMYGSVWGIAIPAAIFNARFERLRSGIKDVQIREQFDKGTAYSFANREILNSLDLETRDQVVNAYDGALGVVWLVALGFSALAFAIVFVEKEVVMEKTLESGSGSG